MALPIALQPSTCKDGVGGDDDDKRPVDVDKASSKYDMARTRARESESSPRGRRMRPSSCETMCGSGDNGDCCLVLLLWLWCPCLLFSSAAKYFPFLLQTRRDGGALGGGPSRQEFDTGRPTLVVSLSLLLLLLLWPRVVVDGKRGGGGTILVGRDGFSPRGNNRGGRVRGGGGGGGGLTSSWRFNIGGGGGGITLRLTNALGGRGGGGG